MRPACPFRTLAACLALVVIGAFPASAKDLGNRGESWPIAEPDLLVAIEARLEALERSGELARLERDARTRARSRLEQPDPVAGIATARVERSRLVDPGIVLDRELRAADGTTIAARGMRIDPLALAPLTRDLLFIDGRRAAEVDWALRHGRASKIVLLAGRPLALARHHGRPFFFDQGGRLAARLGLGATPSLVEQAGLRLRITEIPLEEVAGPGVSAGGRPESGG